MQEKPLVSVLMTSYNREKFIAEAIKSVLSSTYHNFELIIVDDRSSDSTVEIAKSYASKDNRIKVFINDYNLGDYPNRNKAASYANGKYIKYVDADDLIYPFGLEILVNMMEEHSGAGYGLCSLNQNKDKIFPFQLTPAEAYRYHFFGPGLFHKAPLSSIIKKEVFVSAGGFSGKQHLGDYELWLKLSSLFPVVLMPHGIVWYREHADQQMTENNTNPLIPFKYLILAKDLIKSISPLSEKENIKIVRRLDKKIIKSYLQSIIRLDFQTIHKMINFRF